MSSSHSLVPTSVRPRWITPRAVNPSGGGHLKNWTRRLNGLRDAHRRSAERNRLLLQHLPQVHHIARSLRKRLPQHIPLEDLVSAGTLGLIEALDRFDPSKQIKLESYSRARIRGAILDSLRELDHCSRTLRRRAREIARASHLLGNRLGRNACEPELAAEMGMALERFQRLRRVLYERENASLRGLALTDPARPDGGDGQPGWQIPATTEDPFSLCLRSEMHHLLAQAIHRLSARRRQVVMLYYFEEMTMKEVGAKLNIGESRVSQLHSAALFQLRRCLAPLLALESKSFGQGRVQ